MCSRPPSAGVVALDRQPHRGQHVEQLVRLLDLQLRQHARRRPPARRPAGRPACGVDGAGVGALGRKDGDGGQGAVAIGQLDRLPPVGGAAGARRAAHHVDVHLPGRRGERGRPRVGEGGRPTGLQVQGVGQHGHRPGVQRLVEELLDAPAGVLLDRRVDPVRRPVRVAGEVQRPHVRVEGRRDVVEVARLGLEVGAVQRRLLICRESARPRRPGPRRSGGRRAPGCARASPRRGPVTTPAGASGPATASAVPPPAAGYSRPRASAAEVGDSSDVLPGGLPAHRVQQVDAEGGLRVGDVACRQGPAATGRAFPSVDKRGGAGGAAGGERRDRARRDRQPNRPARPRHPVIVGARRRSVQDGAVFVLLL